MDHEYKRKQSFLLRLPHSIRDMAVQTAREDGTSLNHFISLAIAEKISRMDRNAAAAAAPLSRQPDRSPANLRPFGLSRSA